MAGVDEGSQAVSSMGQSREREAYKYGNDTGIILNKGSLVRGRKKGADVLEINMGGMLGEE